MQTGHSLLLRCSRRLWATNEQLARGLSRRQYEVACNCVESNRKKINNFFVVKKRHDRYLVRLVAGSSKSASNFNNRATSAASPASAARYIFVWPYSSRALILLNVVPICRRGGGASVLFVLARKKTNENETTKKEKSDKDQRLLEGRNKKTNENAELTLC